MLFCVMHLDYSKTCVKQPPLKRPKKGSILQYFQPSLSHLLSLRYLFYPFLSGRFTQVLLYAKMCEEYLSSVGGTISLSSLFFRGKGLP